MYQNLFDSHTHSENSPDGHHSVTFMVESAIDKGFHGLAVTDHCECSELEERSYALRLRHCALDVAMAREAFRNRVILTNGIELGQPLYNPEGAGWILAMQHYDFVLLSLHRLRDCRNFWLLDYKNYTPDMLHDLMLRYFDELLESVRTTDFDVLAHLTFPVRYPREQCGTEIDIARYAEPIDEILRALVGLGKGLELNTSGLRDDLGSTLPPAWVIRRYRELGGELVTVGSDAHRAGDIGGGVNDGMQILADTGYEYFAFYRDRQPVMLRII